MTDAAARGETLTVGKLKLGPRTWVLFPNSFRDEAPEKDRPDLYGWVNPGDGSPAYRISSWTKTFEDGHVYLSGSTQYPTPGKTEPEEQDAASEMEALARTGKVTKGLPKKVRGGRGE